MKKQIHDSIILFWKTTKLELVEYAPDDINKWLALFEAYKILNNWLRVFWARWVNLSEGLSEVAFCITMGSHRFAKKIWGNQSTSFDTFNLLKGEAEQIKACSVEQDLTSFWPDSKWDKLYFMDFYNNWNVDWTFDIYEILTELIHNMKVNKEQSFLDQQKQWKRPRLSIKKDIIKVHGLTPIKSKIKFQPTP